MGSYNWWWDPWEMLTSLAVKEGRGRGGHGGGMGARATGELAVSFHVV